MARRLTISETRTQINMISENPEEITVTKRGEPVLAILPYHLYEAVLETLEIACDSEAMSALRADISSVQAGISVKTKSVDDLAKDLGLEL